MQDLLYKGSKEGTALITAVTTRSSKSNQRTNEIQKALNQYHQAEKSLIPEPLPVIERGMTDSELEDPSDLSLSKTGYSKPLQTTIARNKRITLYTPKEKARALKECHYNPLAGHFGTRKTQEKVSQQYI
jgi:hypothetical protein